MKWIPVTEALPRRSRQNPYNTGPVFVFRGGLSKRVHGRYRFGVSCYWFGNDRNRSPVERRPHWDGGPVTHWAYPEEPK